MTMTAGQRLLHYRVVEKVGAGGMGEVYRAEDTRLGRQVAIKVLPAALRADPQRLARLEREARLLASLNHPHVATLHGLEDAEDGTRFLVMEFVEGETLAARLRRGALPLSQVYELGEKIAEALASAHERGIVHRDLKPANVMLTRSGVKLLDFGLAKLAASVSVDTQVETRTHAMERDALTTEGDLVGTLCYMAPEQLEMRDADSRSDVWALGMLLYEMVTGRTPFEGGSKASFIAAILEHEPAPMSMTCPAAPRALEHLVATCLVKDPELRRQSSRDVAMDLRWLASAGGDSFEGRETSAVGSTVARRREWFLWLSVSVLAVALIAIWFVRRGVDSERGEERHVRFEFTVPDLPWDATMNGMALAPQGDAIVYAGPSGPGLPVALWLRDLDDVESRLVDGTEGAINPFWSPDGRHIGYVQNGAIQVVPREGGPPRIVAETGQSFGPPTWSADGTILYSRTFAEGLGGLYRVPAAGGEPEQVTSLVGAVSLGLAFPHWLPDGSGFFYLALSRTAHEPSKQYLGSLDGAEPRAVANVASRVEYARGYLYYWDQGRLVARGFDPDRGLFTGEPKTLGEMTGTHYARTGMALFTAARHGGVVAYGRKQRTVELRWFDRSGRDLGTLGAPGLYDDFRISPDGSRVVVEINDARTGTDDIWIFDVERGVQTRLVGGQGDDSDPAWSPDGERIAYTSDGSGPPAIFSRPADGSGEPETVDLGDGPGLAYLTDWSADGQYMAYRSWTPSLDTHVVSLDGEVEPRLFAGGTGDQVDARFSPDGRWVAFGSSELGSMEIFVASFADGAARSRVSMAGGHTPVWSRDGSELFYATDESLFVVSFASATGAIGMPLELFALDMPLEIIGFDAAPNAQRFLVAVSDQSKARSSITVVVDWPPSVD